MTYSDNPADVEITYLKGVGPKRASALRTVGIETVEDLLYYFPRRYLDRSQLKSIAQLQVGEEVTVVGKIVTQGLLRARKKFYEIVISDDTGNLPLVWFNGIRFIENRFKRGMMLSVSGTVTDFRGAQLVHPEIEVLFDDEDDAKTHTGRIIPLYPSTETLRRFYLDSRGFRKIIRPALQKYADHLVETAPQSVVENAQLTPLPEAIKQMHYPHDLERREKIRQELALRELLLFQLLVADRRKRQAGGKKKHEIKPPDEPYRDLARQLPFRLTGAQKRCIAELIEDLLKPHPMMRLLQGDVGAGKTVVAALTMALVARSGYQAAMMAPTEILAQQHFETVSRILENSGLTVSLLTGSLSAAVRRKALDDLITGRTDILVGTHALKSADVMYRALAYVIVDEQHRFGVAEREALLEKGESPDLLVMTATPIPRTLALTAYGDLDLSILDEKPAGRRVVKSALRTEADRPKIYSFIREEVGKGHKIFMIYPLVQESLRTQMKAATRAYKELKDDIFPDLQIGMVHGQMKKEERDDVMARFSSGELNVLVATTVVEVGIDVPDATAIVIEHAERFGLSQLHQLRGRVGRSERQSYCILMTDVEPESDAYRRLERFVATTDGFEIAELDLELRGPGDLLGKRQSGKPDFRVANLLTDMKLILTAREYAAKLLENALPVTDDERVRLNRFIKRQRELETSSGIS